MGERGRNGSTRGTFAGLGPPHQQQRFTAGSRSSAMPSAAPAPLSQTARYTAHQKEASRPAPARGQGTRSFIVTNLGPPLPTRPHKHTLKRKIVHQSQPNTSPPRAEEAIPNMCFHEECNCFKLNTTAFVRKGHKKVVKSLGLHMRLFYLQTLPRA